MDAGDSQFGSRSLEPINVEIMKYNICHAPILPETSYNNKVIISIIY